MSSLPMHIIGLEQNSDLKQQHMTAQRTLDLIKEEMKIYTSFHGWTKFNTLSWSVDFQKMGWAWSYVQWLVEISIVPCFETTYVLPCRSTTLSLSSSDNEEAPLFLENSKGCFTHEAMEVKMMNGRHLEMKNLLSFFDDTFSMIISPLKERLLPATDPEPHWFWKAMDENNVSLRDLIGAALQHFMEWKVLHQFGKDGIL